MNKSPAPIALVALLACASAQADVTIQEQTSLNVAVIKAHSNSTKRITDDKERSESDFRCEGFMSMFCGKKNGSLKIVRIDRNLTMMVGTPEEDLPGKAVPDPRAGQGHAGAPQCRGGENEVLPGPSGGRQPTGGRHLEVHDVAADQQRLDARGHRELRGPCWRTTRS